MSGNTHFKPLFLLSLFIIEKEHQEGTNEEKERTTIFFLLMPLILSLLSLI